MKVVEITFNGNDGWNKILIDEKLEELQLKFRDKNDILLNSLIQVNEYSDAGSKVVYINPSSIIKLEEVEIDGKKVDIADYFFVNGQSIK